SVSTNFPNRKPGMPNPTFHTTHRSDQIHPTVFVAPHAVIVGDVTLAEQCSVWFHATLRGDVEPIRIGERTNIQEGAVLHVDPGYPVTVGAGVTIGHRAIVHGATVQDHVIIGMGATVLNGAVIGANSIVGANALVTEGKVFPPGSLILGSPAKAVRTLTDEEIERIRQGAATYVARAAAFNSARPD
ncbi:MAG: gamma carbonic anhydrase family protein, partial [Caldilineaceae bacterium]|nr:gamma carbonic anhydrase family protein [Caldilineaceae bacterium]